MSREKLTGLATRVADRNNAPSLLTVNKKPFEKTAVEIGAPVEVKEEAKCTIGVDLSQYLVEEGQVKEHAK